ncbi:urease accessory protein UreF [Saccharibacillus qingshengii]|uniref:urease accessory protein UreF n=1 Tax=Saccharibacillus qingshengii TaxID=1763540 RepID=UPI001555B6AE|nr:urease accessory UreF family protein [Saccharibacillus qingshengii]
MHSGQKLLSYMTLLETTSPSPIGRLNEDINGRRLDSIEAFEEVMRAYIHPRLAHIEGRAIEDFYESLARGDYETVFRLDRSLRTRTSPNEIDTEMRRAGRKLLKLSKSLYPWMNFAPLAEALQSEQAFGCPALCYAWINVQLEIESSEAVPAYLYHHTTQYVEYCSRLLGLDDVSRRKLLMRMIEDVSERWLLVRSVTPPAFSYEASYLAPIQKTL